METVNQVNETNATENESNEQAERTFTQAELDAIVSDRLKRDRAKYADYNELKEKADKFDQIEEQSKTDLQKATERADALQAELDRMKSEASVRGIRDKVANEKGIPVNLLTAETEEECNAQADAILSFAKPNAYPAVKDAGEVRNVKGKNTSDQFADWMKQQFN